MEHVDHDDNDDNDDQHFKDDAETKRRIVQRMFYYSAVLGVIACFAPEDDVAVDLVLGLPFVFLTMSWCFTDANQRDYKMGSFMRFSLVLFFVFALPMYFLRTRGWGAFQATGLAILLMAAMFACTIATMLITAMVGEVTGLWEVYV